MSHKARIDIEEEEYGHYAISRELEGCQTQGDLIEEIIANMKEATELFLEKTTIS